MPGDQTSLSKFLALVLRHRPEALGVTLSNEGWVPVDELLAALAAHGRDVDFAALERLVVESDKQRFAFSADRRRIRANQGHSVQVDLGLSPAQPPDILFHGTVARFLPSIHELGLHKGERQHVHLSASRELALIVGSRRGAPVALEVDARAMTNAGHRFYSSTNGVWLTDHVPPQFLLPITAD
jgi:putative RNA 2'-phosphotransferase